MASSSSTQTESEPPPRHSPPVMSDLNGVRRFRRAPVTAQSVAKLYELRSLIVIGVHLDPKNHHFNACRQHEQALSGRISSAVLQEITHSTSSGPHIRFIRKVHMWLIPSLPTWMWLWTIRNFLFMFSLAVATSAWLAKAHPDQANSIAEFQFIRLLGVALWNYTNIASTFVVLLCISLLLIALTTIVHIAYIRRRNATS